MKRQQLVARGSLNRILLAAEEAWGRSDFQQCFDLMKRASLLDPANVRILLQTAQFHGLRCQYPAAANCFEKAFRFATNKTEILSTAARLSADFASPNLAEHYFESVLKQSDASAETIARAAEFHERLRRRERAAELVERALQLDKACAPALLLRARLDRQAGRLNEAETGIRSLLTAPERHTRTRAYYELGAILDRQGRFDEAMAALLEAKSLLKPEAPPFAAQIKTVREHLIEMLATISAARLRSWFDFGASLQPSRRLGLLCGHPRSGTTLLEQVLDTHPEIVSAEETDIFQADAYQPLGRHFPRNAPMLSILEGAQVEALQRSREDYFRTMELHLAQPVGSRLLIDKNPSFNALIPAFVRVFPEAKFLVALRDPRDVCLSCFMQAFVPLSKAGAPGLTLESTIEGYLRLMGLWQSLRPLLPNSWLEVRYEDIVDDLESVSRKTLNFLGLPWDDQVLRFDEHARGKRVRSPTYADVAKPVFRTAIGRWRNYQRYFEPYLSRLEPLVRAFGYE